MPAKSRSDAYTGAAAFLPGIGAAIGAFAFLLAAVFAEALPPLPLAALSIALSSLLSGGLHLDGLADTFDALG
ncbi:MAG TPA: adenosylcobinamide-GDP ribazoletransferase, partial [Planctomycetota bacterium]|nr:adenosylcobinamide-GDP ribazoletransferase [Planctomycetota bacterium]